MLSITGLFSNKKATFEYACFLEVQVYDIQIYIIMFINNE